MDEGRRRRATCESRNESGETGVKYGRTAYKVRNVKFVVEKDGEEGEGGGRMRWGGEDEDFEGGIISDCVVERWTVFVM